MAQEIHDAARAGDPAKVRSLFKDHIRPQKIILRHMRPNDTDRYAAELGQAHDNIQVFHESHTGIDL